MLKKLPATLTAFCALALLLMFVNCGTSSSRPSGIVLVSSQGDNTLLAYKADLNSGELTQIDTSTSTTDLPTAVIFDPGGAFRLCGHKSSQRKREDYSVPSRQRWETWGCGI